MVESDLFDCHDVVGVFISGLVDDSVGTLTDFVDALVAVDFVGC